MLLGVSPWQLSPVTHVNLDLNNVLIVEDEVLIALDLVDVVCSAGGHAVGPAVSVRQAHEHLNENLVTAAILDVNLGNEDSLDVARRLRCAGIPFIYHSGHFDQGDRSWPLAPLARKPADARTLIAALERAASATKCAKVPS